MTSSSPVHMLPDDVLYGVLRTAYVHSIFPYCEGGNRRQRLLQSPIPFSHVSRRWRGLALSVPSIWSCIHFDQPAGPRGNPLGSVETYLTRSGQLPLSIHFRCHINFESNNGSPEAECPCFAAWNMLIEQAEESADADRIKDAYEALLDNYPNTVRTSRLTRLLIVDSSHPLQSSAQIAYLGHFLSPGSFHIAESLFSRFLRPSPSVELWKFYLVYVRYVWPLFGI